MTANGDSAHVDKNESPTPQERLLYINRELIAKLQNIWALVVLRYASCLVLAPHHLYIHGCYISATF